MKIKNFFLYFILGIVAIFSIACADNENQDPVIKPTKDDFVLNETFISL